VNRNAYRILVGELLESVTWVTEKEMMVYQENSYSARCELGRTDSASCHVNWILASSGL